MPLEVLPIATAAPCAAASASAAMPAGENLLALGLYVAMAVGLIAFLLVACRLIGRKTHSKFKDQPYESGVDPTGGAHPGRPVPFYLVAIFFIAFDVEVVFISSWAVAYDLLGWNGFFQILFFIVILFLGLLYLWAEGALDWGPPRRRRNTAKEDR